MSTSILTINPGTLYWGVSVFHGRTLHISLVKNLSAKGSPGNRLPRMKKVFLSLIRKYAPHILVLKKPYDHWTNQSEYLDKIIQEIKQLSKKMRLKVVEFSPGTIRKVVCRDEKATKADVTRIVGQSYPELKSLPIQSRESKRKYWAPLWESVALGLCYLESRQTALVSKS